MLSFDSEESKHFKWIAAVLHRIGKTKMHRSNSVWVLIENFLVQFNKVKLTVPVKENCQGSYNTYMHKLLFLSLW